MTTFWGLCFYENKKEVDLVLVMLLINNMIEYFSSKMNSIVIDFIHLHYIRGTWF